MSNFLRRKQSEVAYAQGPRGSKERLRRFSVKATLKDIKTPKCAALPRQRKENV